GPDGLRGDRSRARTGLPASSLRRTQPPTPPRTPPSWDVQRRVGRRDGSGRSVQVSGQVARPFLMPLFTEVRGRGILRSSQPLATLKQHQRYALWGIRLCPTSYRLRGLASRSGGLYTFLPLPH